MCFFCFRTFIISLDSERQRLRIGLLAPMVRLDHGFCNGTGFIIKMFKLQAVYIYSIDHQCFLIMWDRCSYSYVFAFFTDVIIHSVRVVGEPLSPFPATRRYCQKHSKLLVYLDSETVRRSRDTATTDFFLSSWTCWMITLCTCFDCPIYRVVEMVESCNSSKLLDEGESSGYVYYKFRRVYPRSVSIK